MKIQKGFLPTEIIFAATSQCNLRCGHCFVHRNNYRLSIESCVSFIESCKAYDECQVEKIGFSGGEPFLYMDFLCSLIQASVKNDFMFDRLMTNGVWWNSEDDLVQKLQSVYDAGFDGKIGLSWDDFHNQDFDKIITFICKVHDIFGKESIEIQSVIKADDNFEDKINQLAKKLDCSVEKNINKKGKGLFILQNDEIYLPLYREPQTYQCNCKDAWQAKKWFKDDYCQGPGNVLFVHPDGNIAPCCGFANEEKALFIGNVNQTFEQIMNQAKENKMVQICYNSGLGKLRKTKAVGKILKEKGFKKTDDLCTFCQFICQQNI